MNFTFLKNPTSDVELQELRKKCDCIMMDKKKMNSTDLFMVNEADYDKRFQPLRLLVCNLSELDPYWKILNDPMKRNTMVVSPDDEVINHPDIVRLLESMGVALLMAKRSGANHIDLGGLTKSLSSLRFNNILVEGEIDLIPELNLMASRAP